MDQETKISSNEQITLVDVLKMFKGKLKVVICVALVAAVIGAAAGVAISFLSAQYGGDIKFYLTPGQQTQTLIQHLQSESFAEKLLLDENGLPANADKNDPDYKAAIEAIELRDSLREQSIELHKTISAFSYTVYPDSEKEYERISFNEIDAKYNNLVAEYNRIYNLLQIYKSTYSDVVAGQAGHDQKTQEYQNALEAIELERNEYKAEFYDPKVNDRIKLNDEYSELRAALSYAREDADEAIEKVVAKWRSDKEVQDLINTIQSSVTYNYADVVDEELIKDTEELEDIKNNVNYSFLEITVAVDNDEETAQLIIDAIKSRAPIFIEDRLERISGVSEAKCTLISTFSTAHDVSETSMIMHAVIYAAVAGLAAALIVCAVIVVKGTLPDEDFGKKSKKKN